MAIREQLAPRRMYPLQWSFKTIIDAYNNFPEMDELYSLVPTVRRRVWLA